MFVCFVYVSWSAAGSQTLREHKWRRVESMQAKWDEMFGEKKEDAKKEDEVIEEVKVKKPRKKAVAKTVQKDVKSTQPKTKSKAKKLSVRKVAERSRH